jgi:hypothetical protein
VSQEEQPEAIDDNESGEGEPMEDSDKKELDEATFEQLEEKIFETMGMEAR